MLSLIAFFSVLVAVLAICGVSSFKLERTKLSSFVFLKGIAILSILCLALTASNLASNMKGTTLFILLAIGVQVFSAILASIPTKDDIFKILKLGLDMTTSLFLALAGLLLAPLSSFGLPIGIGVGLIAMLVLTLINKQSFNYKTDLFKYFKFAFACGLLAQVVVILISTISVQTIIFAIGAIIYYSYLIMQMFIGNDKKELVITKNIIYYLSLIILASSIFMGVF